MLLGRLAILKVLSLSMLWILRAARKSGSSQTKNSSVRGWTSKLLVCIRDNAQRRHGREQVNHRPADAAPTA